MNSWFRNYSYLSEYLLAHAFLPDHNVVQHVEACILLGKELFLVFPDLNRCSLRSNAGGIIPIR